MLNYELDTYFQKKIMIRRTMFLGELFRIIISVNYTMCIVSGEFNLASTVPRSCAWHAANHIAHMTI